MGHLNREPNSQDKAPGDSTEQIETERLMLDRLGVHLGVKFDKRRFDLPGGGWIEVDGVSGDPLILCEAWAHQGPPKSAQKHKVMSDAFKLLFVANLVGHNAQKILLFGDEAAADHFRGKSWMAQALQAHNIEVRTVDLPEETRLALWEAQKRQFR